MGPEDLEKVLDALPRFPDDRVLVGLDSPDDAAVYRLDGEAAVAATLDFFTPLVDGPEDYGAIAAANAFSDLYAMNVDPAFALSVLAIPAGELPEAVVEGILDGATEVCRRAGVVIAGGHSIDDQEPKFGLVALGLGEPEELFRKSGGRPGDALVLGKALGTGVVTTGIKTGQTSDASAAAAIRSMRRLNREAMEIAREHEVHAATDVTGFGLLGHLWEICRASGTGARVRAGSPRILPQARELAAQECVPGGTRRNRESVEEVVRWSSEVDEVDRTLLCDAQTSGGLLVCVPERDRRELAERWRAAGYQAAAVGELEETAGDAHIQVEG